MRLYGIQGQFSMATAKQEVREILDQLPDESTMEDIQYRLYLVSKVRRRLKDIQEGRVLNREEVERRMSRWLGK
jgi:hypothetical protein